MLLSHTNLRSYRQIAVRSLSRIASKRDIACFLAVLAITVNKR
jgi:hypothetical protein